MTTSMRGAARWPVFAILGGSALFGCDASLGDGAGTGGADAGGQVAGLDPEQASGDLDLDDLWGVDPETLPDEAPAASRVPRLGYAEYDRTVGDLLGIVVDASTLFPGEEPNLGPYDSPGGRIVTERLLAEYTLAAEALAEEVVSDAVAYQNLVGCDPLEASCKETFVRRFGRRAYRRPLTDAEVARHLAQFDRGGELIQSGDAFRDGVQLLVESVLGSAKFLYRPEVGSGEVDDGGTRLTAHELATRLSFLFWGTMPDAELAALADAGELTNPEVLASEAERLAASPRARDKVLDFHERWFQLESLAAASKDPAVFPEYDPDLARSMETEFREFVEETTLAQDGAIGQLLTSNVTFVDAPLAELYGVAGDFSAGRAKVELPLGRRGLFTQAAFLTGHSSASTRTSPILRGVFLQSRVLCEEIPPPPPGAEMQEPEAPPTSEILTTRQYFEWKTSMSECAGCHMHINPAGFAFEGFDAIGRFRTQENGAPVDPSGVIEIDDAELAFGTADELLSNLAGLPRVRACYAKNWVEFAFGRPSVAGDLRTIGRATRDLEVSGFGVRDLLVLFTKSAAFEHLAPTL